MDAAAEFLLNQTTADGGSIRVWQHANLRYLDFADGLLQSAIDLQNPNILPLSLNRAMLAGVIFSASIKRVLLVGTGGGAIARFLAQRFPEIYGEAVEISAEIAEIARHYFQFPASWPIYIEDIRHFISGSQPVYDLIVLDIAMDQKTPDWILQSQFMQQCRARLTTNGHLAINLLVDDAEGFLAAMRTIRQVFDMRTVCLSLENHRNIVVFGFNGVPDFLPPIADQRMQLLTQRWSIELDQFYQYMQKENPAGSGIF
ncbi:MAG: fused MFS/spermidine synthase [Methylophaga sp.]|nr:fused MFS/spermidine synthase [Methylophaga sp.]